MESHDHPESTTRESFYHDFQQQVSALRDQMDQTQQFKPSEKKDMINIKLEEYQSEITRLSNMIQDATHNLPAYDQRTYSETIKSLQEQLQQLRNHLTPKPKFSFKSTSTGSGSAPGSGTGSGKLAAAGGSRNVLRSSGPVTAQYIPSSDEDASRTSKSVSNSLLISDKNNVYLDLPSNSNQPEDSSMSASISNIKRCIVNLIPPPTTPYLPPTTQGASSSSSTLATIALKNIKDSLILAGRIDGPAHITGLEKTILILLGCRQFRLHDSRNIDVYISCGTRPIIENCEGVRFAPVPHIFRTNTSSEEGKASSDEEDGNWNQIDDFNWLRNDQSSPNWKELSLDRRLDEALFTELLEAHESKKEVDVEGLLARTVDQFDSLPSSL